MSSQNFNLLLGLSLHLRCYAFILFVYIIPQHEGYSQFGGAKGLVTIYIGSSDQLHKIFLVTVLGIGFCHLPHFPIQPFRHFCI